MNAADVFEDARGLVEICVWLDGEHQP
jgi:hypothetical protein